MAFGIERARARHLDHVAAPFAFRAEQLDERASAAHPLPWRKRHVLHAPHADAAKDWNALALHEIVIGRVRPLPSAVSGVLITLRFVPMLRGRHVVHVSSPIASMLCGFLMLASIP